MNREDWASLVEAAALRGAVEQLGKHAKFEQCLTRVDGIRLVRLSLPEEYALLKTAALLDRLSDEIAAVAPFTVIIEISIKRKQKPIQLPEHRSMQ